MFRRRKQNINEYTETQIISEREWEEHFKIPYTYDQSQQNNFPSENVSE